MTNRPDDQPNSADTGGDIDKAIKAITDSITFKITTGQTNNEEELYKPKHYKIPSVIKTAKAKLKSDGIDACIGYITSILNDTEQLQKDQSISLTKNLVKILVSKKHESLNDFEKLVNNSLSKHSVQTDPMFYSSIAEIYLEHNPSSAVDYLSAKNQELAGNKTFQALNYYLFLDKVKILIEAGDLTRAEKEIQQANSTIENNSMFQFLSDKRKFTDLFAELKLNQGDYRNHLKFSLITFVLEIMTDLSHFPLIHGFHHRKKLCYAGEQWGLNYEDFEEVPADKKISANSFEKLKNDVYEITFNLLPITLGFDTKYTNDELPYDEFQKEHGIDGFMKFKEITDAPFKEYEWIENCIEDFLKAYNY
jgi:hypothetical protein